MAGKAAGAAPRQKMRKLYIRCGSGWAVLHSLRYEGPTVTPAQLVPELNALQTLELTPLQMEEILFTLSAG